MLDHRGCWDAAFRWEDYLEREVKDRPELWKKLWERSAVTEAELARAARLGGPWRLLVISEDWCGDAVNTVPVLARLAEAAPGLEMRVVKRDENPELMDRYLTGASRSIPLAVVLDADFCPVGRWGPRPAELQDFVLREKAAKTRPSAEIYRDARAWYARDRGATTVRELLDVIERAARAKAA